MPEEIMKINIPLLIKIILEEYSLPVCGYHGVGHWARVLENGERLSEETGANLDVVRLFAVLHDSRRQNESFDPEHGPRAAEFAADLRGTVFELDDDGFSLLSRACSGHTKEENHSDITIQTCWDSDRLDLGRVGITPHPSRLCTEIAKQPEFMIWADSRAKSGFVPALVLEEWEIELGSK